MFKIQWRKYNTVGGIVFNIDNKLYIREEKNGITVYEKDSNLYKFYKGLNINKIQNIKEYIKVNDYLEKNNSKISTEIDFYSPFRINWLIEERCNLDCIYCFAYDKMENNETRDNILETANPKFPQKLTT